jgi:plastocyanin
VIQLLSIFALLVVTAVPPATEPSIGVTQAVGSVRGVVHSPGEVPLSEMVVYLVPDDEQKITAPTEVVKVSQKGAQFAPPLVIVCVGQTVEFPNDEDRPIEHNVFSNSPAKTFDLGLYKPGESKAVTFDKPGPVAIFCSIHRKMDGTIFVSPTPYFSRVEKDGKYEIRDVPPGHWVLTTWQRRRRFLEAQEGVKVVAGEACVKDVVLKKK